MAACISGSAYTTAANSQAAAIKQQAIVDSAIQVAVALWQRNSSQSISNMQTALADQQVRLAEQIQAHAVLYWPEEAELVNDVFAEGLATTQYLGLAANWGGLTDNALATSRTDWIQTMRDACMAPSRCEDARWQRNAQLARADMLSYAARQDETRTEILNDRRYARQLAVLGLGRGLVADLISYQRTGLLNGIEASQALLGTVNSALTAYGYYSARKTPQGWGSGIQETWARMPQADLTVRALPSVAPNPIAPVAKVDLQISKSNEDKFLMKDLEGMGYFDRKEE